MMVPMDDLGMRTFQAVSAERAARWHGDTPWSLCDWMVALIGEVGEAATAVAAASDEVGTDSLLMVQLMSYLGEAANVLKKLNRHRDGVATERDPGVGVLVAEMSWHLKVAAELAGGFARGDERLPVELAREPGELGAELADTQAYLSLVAEAAGVDLAGATVAKFNVVSERQGWPEFVFPALVELP